MCLKILKSPVAAIAEAKKKRDINKTIITLLEFSAVFGLAASLITTRAAFSTALFAGSFLNSMSIFVILAVFLGLVVSIAAVNLGGKGEYYEGFTAVTYAFAPLSAGLLAISVLGYLPAIGSLISFFVMFPVLAAALSVLYRAVKELYKTDMITSFATVSITLTVLVIATLFFSSLALA